MQELTEAQANPEVVLNENFETLEHQSVYGKRQPATTGLTWGYYGGRWGGAAIADGTLSLSASSTNYVVVLRSSGAISVSTTNTNWNNTTDYARVYLITTSAGAVSTVQDHRVGPYGVHGQSSVAGGSVDADDVTYTPTTLSDWDGGADPGDVEQALDQLAERVTDVEAGGSGIGGSTGATDNVLLRADGTGGATLQATGVTVSDADEIHGYLAKLNLQTGTTYTLDVAGTDTDSGKIVDLANAGAIAVTLPATAPVGYACTAVQGGAGQITFASTGSGTLVNRQSHTKTAGQYAMVSLYVRANAGGSAAVWVLGGDTAA